MLTDTGDVSTFVRLGEGGAIASPVNRKESRSHVEERNPGSPARRGAVAANPAGRDTTRDRGNRRDRAASRRARREEARKLVRHKRTMTDEQRKAVAERMRKYWASRREAKAQQEAAPE